MASATVVSRAERGTADPVRAVSYDRLARFHIGEEDTLTAQLATLGYAPAEVDTAILSHLHQGYIGGLPGLASADLLVARAEWAELSKPVPEPRGFPRQHIQLPGRSWTVDGGGSRGVV